jgi:hypothetical protein
MRTLSKEYEVCEKRLGDTTSTHCSEKYLFEIIKKTKSFMAQKEQENNVKQ